MTIVKYKHPMTAAELLARLDKDPDYQRRKAEKQQRRAIRNARLSEALHPVLVDLAGVGVEAESIHEMVKRYAPLPPHVVEVLLKWLPRVEPDRFKGPLISALGAADKPFDGRPLVHCFERDKYDSLLRWPIANTMALARPFGISEWLETAVTNPLFGNARQMLVLALARLAPRETSLPILVPLLDELPGHVASALAEVGGATELKELQARARTVDKDWEREAIADAIRTIAKRLGDSGNSAEAINNLGQKRGQNY